MGKAAGMAAIHRMALDLVTEQSSVKKERGARHGAVYRIM
jgi:hypothetical protein